MRAPAGCSPPAPAPRTEEAPARTSTKWPQVGCGPAPARYAWAFCPWSGWSWLAGPPPPPPPPPGLPPAPREPPAAPEKTTAHNHFW
eukprot:9504023-Pyramimonas_sp.AAC.3